MGETGKELQTEVWGVGADVEAWEISVPRARLMQAKTKDVEKNPKKIFQGEIRSSLDLALLGSSEDMFEVVIFGRVTQWGVYRPTGKDQLEWVRYEPLNARTATLDKKFIEHGVEHVRKQITRYYAINTKEENSLPYEIVMKGMSFMTTRSLNAKFLQLSRVGKSSLDVVIGLKTELMEFNGNSNWGFVFSVLRDSDPAEKALATSYARSFDSIARAAAKVPDEDSTSDADDAAF